MTTVWDEVVSAALVGTERRRFDVALLAGVVPPDQLEVDGAEASVLAAAAVLASCRRAGRLPDAPRRPPGPAAPPDDRPVAPAVAVQVLELLLDGHVTVAGGNAALVGHWLAACAASGHRPPETLLVPLLLLGTATVDLRSTVAAVVGPRGAWLAGHNPAWSWTAPVAPLADGGNDLDARFAIAGRAERAAVLDALRGSDPGRARALVASTWSSESAADRVALLEMLGAGLGDDDEPFLEDALDDRAASVRAAAARLLGRLPHSRRSARMAARARPLVRMEGRLRRRLAVDLPDEPDAAARRDGVDDRAEPGYGRRAWWLVQLVAGTPLAAWEEHLGTEPPEIVRLAAAETELLDGLARAVVAQGDRRWALALAARWPRPAVLAVLDAGDATAVAGRALAAGAVPDAALAALLEACAGPWPDEFSSRVVRHCRTMAGRVPALVRPVLPVLARRLSPAVLQAVEEWISEDDDESAFRRDLRTVAHALTIRRTIDEELR